MTAYGTIGAAVEADAARGRGLPGQAVRARRDAAGHPPGASSSGAAGRQRRQSLRRNQERFTFTNLVAEEREDARDHGAPALGRAARHHRPDPRRDRGREGAAGAVPPLRRAAARQAVRRGQLRGDSRGAVRVGALRVPPGRLHRARPSTRRGHFQMASGGTLSSTRSGRCRSHLQSKLLRAIEEKKITSIGAERPIDIDVRFIATTNKDLQGGRGARGVPSGSLLPALGVADPRSASARAAWRTSRRSPRISSSRERPTLQEERPELRAGERSQALVALSVARATSASSRTSSSAR